MHFIDYFIHTGCPKLLAYCFNTRSHQTHIKTAVPGCILTFSVDSSSCHIIDTFKLTYFVTNNIIIYIPSYLHATESCNFQDVLNCAKAWLLICPFWTKFLTNNHSMYCCPVGKVDVTGE